jgi:dGTPase
MLYTNADYDRRLKEEGKKNKSNADWRTEFRRDFSRLIHSPSYRRLQGKTQVFPGVESDFFRNRITHSQEVAQVAKSIALMFNEREEFFKRKGKIDLDLVEFAGLAHDLGHPPFGHNGEKALDECMLEYGGFEGNAQTLRILSKVEKKVKGPKSNGEGILSNGKDMRFGLNLTYRSLASILKYDAEIPLKREDGANLVKGYYASERDLVQKIKDNFKVTGLPSVKFKTLECTIMDIADDIAYSTFDLEDAFKSGILSPLDLLSLTDPIIEVIREKVAKSMGKPYAADDIKRILASFFLDKFRPHLENVRSNFDHRAELSTDILPQIMGGGFAITREIGLLN